MASRFSLLIGAFAVAFGLLAFHMYDLQVKQGGFYLARAESEAIAAQGVNGARGAIAFTDKNGTLLPVAVEKEYPIVYAVPASIADPQLAAEKAAPILGMSPASLAAIFSRPHDQYELLVRKADPSVAQAITDLNMKGLYADYLPSRYYPLGKTASQVIGYVGPNAANGGESGHYGIEEYYNSTLAQGTEVDLTIDPNVQIEAEKILDNLIKANNATGGDVLVEDPMTGKILAMGAYPDFDPNDYGKFSVKDFVNPTMQGVYEPGSIVKVLTMSAGINSGKIMPNETYDDKGYVNVDGAHITNYNLLTHGPYGPGTTMTEIIEHSINTGAIFLENQMGNAIFTEYMKAFGLGMKTGIDLPGEIAGDLRQLNPSSPQVDFDTAAYGQGIAMTPVELVAAVGAIATGGVLMRPYLDASMKPQEIRRVISTTTAAAVTKMMVSAVDLAGVASIKGYALAGKTGSAYIPNLKTGGYENELSDSYIGFGPASNPRFIAFIRLDGLSVNSLAAESVVPAFRELSQYIINYYNIPPDRP